MPHSTQNSSFFRHTMSPTAAHGGTSSISSLHPDTLTTHILTRLDGPTLAATSCTCTEFNSLITCNDDLWTNICFSTWPSLNSPRMHHLISRFPSGARAFFAQSFPLIPTVFSPPAQNANLNRPNLLISAVDIYYRGEIIFSKLVETETESGWFNCSPFRIDMLDPKETCPTPVPESSLLELPEDLTVSWILVDPAEKRAMNVSSRKPVSVQKHWLSGDVHARFSVVLAGERGSASEFVQCGILITCGGGPQGILQAKEVSLQMEDMDGMYLNGRDSLGILVKGLGGKMGKRRSYEEFMEMKRERKERKARTEGRLDMLCVAFGLMVFAAIGLFTFFR